MVMVPLAIWLATHVSTSTDPLGDFYRSLFAKGLKPTMARLTLARKLAAISGPSLLK
jgi:hypothetical protein